MTTESMVLHPGGSLKDHYALMIRLLDGWGEAPAACDAQALLAEMYERAPENASAEISADNRLKIERALLGELPIAEPDRRLAVLCAASDVALVSRAPVPRAQLARMRWLAWIGQPCFAPAMARDLAALWRLDQIATAPSGDITRPAAPTADILAFTEAISTQSRIATIIAIAGIAADIIPTRRALLGAPDQSYDALILWDWLAALPDGASPLALAEISRVLRPQGSVFLGLAPDCQPATIRDLCQENGLACLYLGAPDTKRGHLAILQSCRRG